MNISLISSIFPLFVFTIIQSISVVAEEERKMYVNFSFELILVSSYIANSPEWLYLFYVFKFISFVDFSMPFLNNFNIHSMMFSTF